MAKRVMVFGGTFDPVHFGHLIVARSVAEQLAGGPVLMMPAAVPPHKAAPAVGPEHRLAMLKLAVQDDRLFQVVTRELDRTGLDYTYDTLVDLGRTHGAGTELVWVIGLDMLADLPNWHRARELVDVARIVTAVRPPMHENVDACLAALRRHFSGEQVARLGGDILRTPLLEISSTDIRRRLRAGMSVRYLTPDAVIEYIRRNQLYGAAAG